MKKTYAILIFGLAILPGYSNGTNSTQTEYSPQNKAYKIHGQVYITKKDRETVKMSLVNVRIVNTENYSAVLNQVASYMEAKRKDTELKGRASALVKAMPRMSATNRAIADKTYAQIRSQVLTNLPNAELGSKPMFELFSSADWKEYVSVQTDADGNFSAEVPSGSWKIVALSQRKIIDTEEEYIWFVSVPNPPTNKIFLNNSNLFDR